MVRLKAKKLRNYNQRNLTAGEPFDASDKDARILLLADGLVEHDTDEPSEISEEPKRRYKRRDLVAE